MAWYGWNPFLEPETYRMDAGEPLPADQHEDPVWVESWDLERFLGRVGGGVPSRVPRLAPRATKLHESRSFCALLAPCV